MLPDSKHDFEELVDSLLGQLCSLRGEREPDIGLKISLMHQHVLNRKLVSFSLDSILEDCLCLSSKRLVYFAKTHLVAVTEDVCNWFVAIAWLILLRGFCHHIHEEGQVLHRGLLLV